MTISKMPIPNDYKVKPIKTKSDWAPVYKEPVPSTQTFENLIRHKMDEACFYSERNETIILEYKGYKIHLQNYGVMQDPVALFRPQILYSWHGTIEKDKKLKYYIFFVAGTDDGMDDVDIFIEPSVDEIKRKLKSRGNRKMYTEVENIIPKNFW